MSTSDERAPTAPDGDDPPTTPGGDALATTPAGGPPDVAVAGGPPPTPTGAGPTGGAPPDGAAAVAPASAAAPGAEPPGEVLIEARGLAKYYGPFTAIEDVSFEVRRGEVVAFLGPNGAGKSTTMRILTGVLAPDRGEARICGRSVIDDRLAVLGRLGYLPENGPLWDDMTPDALLRFLGAARGLSGARLDERVEAVTRRLSLGSVRGKAIHKLSRGYRQRVGLAQALLHEPDVLVLDEPTNGLDPNQIRDVRRTIRALRADKGVLLSTHILQEVEAVADRVVFIHDGRIVFQGTVEALKASAARGEGPAALDLAFARHTGAERGQEVPA